MEAAFFDLDKTVIARASLVAFGRPFYRHGLVSRSTLLRGLWAQLVYLHLGASEARLARLREALLRLTRGWDQSQVRAIVASTLEDIVEPIIYQDALDLIAAHRRAGRLVYLVSASPEEIVMPLGSYLGVDGVIASRSEVDENGRYTGEVSFYAYGPYKATAIYGLADERAIDLAESYAYSDSYTDVPMLEAVGHPVAVNPDRVLAGLARERGWPIQRFDRPVRLRRSTDPRLAPAVLAAVTVLVGAAGVVLTRRLAARRPAWST